MKKIFDCQGHTILLGCILNDVSVAEDTLENRKKVFDKWFHFYKCEKYDELTEKELLQ